MEEEKKVNIVELGKGIFIIALFQVLPYFVSPFFYNIIKNGGFWTRNFAYLLYEMILVGIFCVIYRKTLVEDWKDFKKNRKEYMKVAIPLWIKGLILMVVSNYMINIFITNGNIAANESFNRSIMLKLPIYSITSMVFLGPIMEELVFRKSLKKAFSNMYVFAIVSALIFAGFHVATGIESFSAIFTQWKELLFIIPYGALGYMFAIAYHKTNNIFTSISMHIMHNSLSVGLVLLSFLLSLF